MKKALLIVLLLILMISCGKSKENMSEGKDYGEYVNEEILISPKKAKELIESNKNLVILDIRKNVDFITGHIPGAVSLWRDDISAYKEEYPFGGMRASKEKMEKLFSEMGINQETVILMYDAKADYDAAKLWWILDIYGHEKMHLIDGGLAGWKAANLETELGPSKRNVEKSTYKFEKEPNEEKIANLEDVKSALENEKVIILDTRSEGEHLGRELKSGAFRKGRIPSEYFLEWKELTNYSNDKTFKTPKEIEEILKSKGITKDKEIIAYCQSGVRSAHMTFVLTQLLGWENVKNYDGSWIEWSYYEELPLEIGE